MRRHIKGTVPALAALSVLVLISGTAQAETSRSCVYNLQSIAPANVAGEITVFPVKEACYSTMSQANDMALAVSPAGSFFDGDDWGHINWSGENLVWTSQHTCDEGYVLNLPSMPSGWNDRVRSAQRASACQHWVHFENANYGGALDDCHPGNDCLTMGVLAAQTSSERWHN